MLQDDECPLTRLLQGTAIWILHQTLMLHTHKHTELVAYSDTHTEEGKKAT